MPPSSISVRAPLNGPGLAPNKPVVGRVARRESPPRRTLQAEGRGFPSAAPCTAWCRAALPSAPPPSASLPSTRRGGLGTSRAGGSRHVHEDFNDLQQSSVAASLECSGNCSGSLSKSGFPGLEYGCQPSCQTDRGSTALEPRFYGIVVALLIRTKVCRPHRLGASIPPSVLRAERSGWLSKACPAWNMGLRCPAKLEEGPQDSSLPKLGV